MILINDRVIGQVDEVSVANDKEVIRLEFRCKNQVTELFRLTDSTVFINYQNGSTKDRYAVTDVTQHGEYVTFSWTLGANATKKQGKTFFVVCAVITEDEEVLQEWNTELAFFNVNKGLECETQPSEDMEDLFAQLTAMVEENAGDITALDGSKQDKLIAGDNITINGNVISASSSVDAYTKAETDALLDEKQDTLTAGQGITILNNIISATASSVRTVFTPTKATYLTSEIETGIYDVAGGFVISTGYYDERFTVGEGSILVFQNLTQGFFRAIVIGGLDNNELPDVLICGRPDTDSDFEVGYLSLIYNDFGVAISNLENAIQGKQNTLTAGNNITIVNDVISAVIDLTNYYTKTETDTLLNAKADTSALASKLDTNQGSANEGKVMTVGADGIVSPQTAQGTTYTAGQNITISAQNVISAGIEVIEL